MTDPDPAPKRRSWRASDTGPNGTLGLILVFVGLALSFLVNPWLGIALMLVGVGLGMADALAPWRRGETDVWGRRKTPGDR